jgi:alkylation response protein AidB-like acyl-CoA dehydrogenase
MAVAMAGILSASDRRVPPSGRRRYHRPASRVDRARRDRSVAGAHRRGPRRRGGDPGRVRATGPARADGVWAADAPDARVHAEPEADGWRLRGRKRYCSGATGLDRALVTAQTRDGVRLFDVDLHAPNVRPVPDTWQAVGMAATDSLDVTFHAVPMSTTAMVGGPGFYLERPGFGMARSAWRRAGTAARSAPIACSTISCAGPRPASTR